jgi:hypothetical protein
MNSQIQKSLHEDVLPWLFNRVNEFLVDNNSVRTNSYTSIEMGLRGSQFAHGKKIDQINQKIMDREKESQKFQAAEFKRRANRRLARDKRAKDIAKEEFKTRILK